MIDSRESDAAAAYDRLAPEYDDLVTTPPINVWTRRAFQDLVLQTIPTGSLLLDFGCGTGLDASWYAQRGYRVLAYDISAGMLDRLHRRCAPEVARGQIVPVCGPFSSFSAAIGCYPRPDAAVSNFAVLNGLAHPRDFFGAIAPLLAPGAPLIVSVLNPFFYKDMRQGWWWAAFARSARQGALIRPGPGGSTYRHFLASLVAAARPGFHLCSKASVGALVRRGRGTPNWDCPRTVAERIEARFWKTFPLRSCGMFVFLTFRRT